MKFELFFYHRDSAKNGKLFHHIGICFYLDTARPFPILVTSHPGLMSGPNRVVTEILLDLFDLFRKN